MPDAFPKLTLGVSSCLLGNEVRFDGGHKRDAYLLGTLDPYVDWVAVCPEVEVGLPTPRPSLRLVSDDSGGVRLVMPKSDQDWTDPVRAWSASRVEALSDLRLTGYVLKSKSPSCGMERVRIYADSGMPSRSGVGLFAERLLDQLPNLPVEEEGRLCDPRLRENFVTRLFAYARWLDLVDAGLSRGALMEFHARHKYLLMAHNQAGMRRLGRLLAIAAKGSDVKAVASDYLAGFTAVMRCVPTTRNHTNALQHLAGEVTKRIDEFDRQELIKAIDDYRKGLFPLIVPLTLLRHHIVKLDVPYARDQVYLLPHPYELMLLNHV